MQAALTGTPTPCPPPRRAPCARFAAALAAVLLAISLAGRPVAAAPASEPTQVTRASTTVDPGRTTLELTLSDKAGYKVFSLEKPPRVVVDLSGVRWRVGDGEMPRPAGVISQLRLGQPQPGTARLVLNTAGRTRLEAATLKSRPGGGYTLALVLAGKTPAPPSPSPVSAGLATAGAAGDPPPQIPQQVPATPLAADGRLPVTAPIGAASLAMAMAPAPRPGTTEVGAVGGSPGERRSSNGRATPVRRARVVVLDAGHGGDDPGAISARGLYEKHVTLATAREVRSALQAIGGYKVVLTRDKDIFIPLRGRVAIARRAGADLFVSIHADKTEDEAIRGLSVYTLSERASDAEAAALADRENKADLIAHMDLRGAAPDVTGILIDLAQRDTKNSSARMAGLVVTATRSDVPLLQRPHRFAGFAVLKAPDVPSILVELGFLSNPADEAALRSPTGRGRLGRALARAIDSYFTSTEVAKQG
ncbi:MAG: N-acetylmuramoyl-L-alanine amidase [Rhodospirillales bacterium]